MPYIPDDLDPSKKTDIHLRRSLLEGFAPVSLTNNSGVHPVELLQTQGEYQKELQSLKTAGAVYGFHAPMIFVRERSLVAASRRLQPLNSSLLSLDVLLGTEDDFNFSHYLNREIPVNDLVRQPPHLLSHNLN